MKSFKNFIDEEIKKSRQLDAQERDKCINAYKELVKKLYSLVDDEWLADYIPDKISTGEEKIVITERSLGSYEISKKWIKVGDYILYLLPIGTALIGAKARVDLILGAKSIMLLWIDRNINDIIDSKGPRKKAPKDIERNYTWKLVYRNGSTKFCDVDMDSFQRSIMELING